MSWSVTNSNGFVECVCVCVQNSLAGCKKHIFASYKMFHITMESKLIALQLFAATHLAPLIPTPLSVWIRWQAKKRCQLKYSLQNYSCDVCVCVCSTPELIDNLHMFCQLAIFIHFLANAKTLCDIASDVWVFVTVVFHFVFLFFFINFFVCVSFYTLFNYKIANLHSQFISQ